MRRPYEALGRMCQHRAVLSCLSLTCRRRKAGAPSSGDKAASTGDVGVPAGGGGAREASSKGTSMRRAVAHRF